MNVLYSKKLQLAVTLLLCAVIIAGGSFAWFSATQNVLNEFTWNPEGANLHDDFTDPNKDVFVENTGTAPLLVRVQLREFFDINNGEITMPNEGMALKTDKSTWSAHGGGPSGAADCGYDFHNYWTWEMGGQKWYLPATAEHIGAIQERTDLSDGETGYNPADPVVKIPVMKDGLPKELEPFYTGYADLEAAIRSDPEMQKKLTALETAKQALMAAIADYAAGTAEAEQVGVLRDALYTAQEAANTYSRENFHGVQFSRNAKILTMAEWTAGGNGRVPMELGDYWVVDTNGWCYWANTLESGEATGMLLNEVSTTKKIEELKAARKRYYYGIDVTMQAATANDVDKFTNEIYTGKDQAATAAAQELLKRLAAASTENTAATFDLFKLPEEQRGRYWYQDDDGTWMFNDGRWTYDGWEWLLDGESYPFTDHGWYSDEDSGDWWYIDDEWYFDGDEWYYFEPVPTVPPVETPIVPPSELPVEPLPGETPTVPPAEIPGETPTTPPAEQPGETPTTPPAEPPTETPTTPPVEQPDETPTTPPVETPTEAPTTPPAETPTEAPTTPPAEQPGKTPTDPPDDTSPPSEAPAETTPPAAPPDEAPATSTANPSDDNP